MGSKTKIEWCEATWNPVTGCLHGCEYCYARRIAERFGAGKSDSIDGLTVLNEYATSTRGRKEPYPVGFEPTFHRYRLSEPKKWPNPKTIFVCSMADLFGDWVPDKWIKEVFAACEEAPQHTYLFLTKNPKRYAELYRAGVLPIQSNIMYGATTTDKKQLETAAEAFDNIPAEAHKFISIEPIREDVSDSIVSMHLLKSPDWIIVGAETGNRKGKIKPAKLWINRISLVADNIHAALFMKDSLIPIIGEENMRRELPWELPGWNE